MTRKEQEEKEREEEKKKKEKKLMIKYVVALPNRGVKLEARKIEA